MKHQAVSPVCLHRSEHTLVSIHLACIRGFDCEPVLVISDQSRNVLDNH